MMTREDCLNGRVNQEAYYAQFVTDRIKACVKNHFNPGFLARSYEQDREFCDIGLYRWDAIALNPNLWDQEFREKMRASGDFISLTSRVCVLKEAARQIVQERRGL